MDGRALFEQAQLMMTVGAAMRGAAALQIGGGLDARIGAQRALCEAIEKQIAFETAHVPDHRRGSIEVAVNAYSMLGDHHATAGDHVAARASYDRAIALVQEGGDASLYVRAVISLVNQLMSRGAFAETVSRLFAARDAPARIESDPTRQVDANVMLTLTLAQTWRWLGDQANAQVERENARARLAALLVHGTDTQRLLLWSRRTELLLEDMLAALEAGDTDGAQRAYGELEPIYQGLSRIAAMALPLYAAQIAAARGDARAVLALTRTALSDFENSADLRPKLGVLRALRARALLDLGDVGEALVEAREAVKQERAHDQRETIWKAHWRHAQACEAGGRAADALSAYDDAVAAVDGVRRSSLGYRLDNSFLRARRPLFDHAITLAADQGDAVRVARYCDAIKSRFLGAALAQGPLSFPSPDWVAGLDALGERIDALAHAPSPELERLRAERAALIERRRLESSAAEPGAPAMLDVDATLASLDDRGQAALGLFRIGATIVATLLFEGEVRVARIDLDPESERALRRYAANLAQPGAEQSSVDYDPARLRLSAEALLPSAFLETICAARSVLISPHEALNLLPWAVLPIGDRRLCEVVPVGMMPNLAAIVPVAARPSASPEIAIVGAPDESDRPERVRLAASVPEIEALATMYRERGRLIAPPVLGREATLNRVRELSAMTAADGAILHLACHGQFEADDPAGSGLKLMGRTLSAAEVATRPLRFAEVTLSACSTALRPTAVDGVTLVGDDVVGLPASFLEAGATALLVSTTQADDDASAELLLAYHRCRIAGDAPLAALATTQRRMLAEGRYPVRSWGGFHLYACA